jgi:hypothetical protein
MGHQGGGGDPGTIDVASIRIWLRDPRQMIYGRPSAPHTLRADSRFVP